jgi:PAS domain-containing protein
MPDSVLIVEVPSLRTIFANGFAKTVTERILGRPANLDLNDIEGEVLHLDGSPYDRADWPIMRATRGEKVSDAECVYRLPDGKSMTFRISSAPVYDSDGEVVAAVAVGRDITEQEAGNSASLEPGL